MRPEFCEFIIKARHEKNLSQVEAAKKINITQAQISNIEKGIHFPSVETLINMSKVYDVTLDDLLGLKRERSVTVVLGDTASEMRFLSRMGRYHEFNIENQNNKSADEYEEMLLPSIELFKYAKTIAEERLKWMETLIKSLKFSEKQNLRYEKFNQTLKTRDQLEKEGKDTKLITKDLKKQHKEMKKALRKYKV